MKEKTVTKDRDWTLLLLMSVIVLVPVLGPIPQMQGFPWVIRLSVLLPLLPVLLAFIAFKKGAIRISLQPVSLSLLGIILLALLSSLWAINTWGALTGVIKWIYVFLMSVAVYSLAGDEKASDKIMLACAIAGCYMAFVGVTQYLFGHGVYVTPVGEYPWPSATSGHKNMASQFVVMTLPFMLYVSLTARKPLVYWLANPLIAMMLAYIVYGRARQALVALMAQLMLILLVLCFKKSRQYLKPASPNKGFIQSIIASIMLFTALVVAPPFDKPFNWQKTAVSEFASRTEVFTQADATLEQMSSGRFATWKKTASMIADHPAGVGLGNWKVQYPRYNVDAGRDYRPQGNEVWGDAHNDYLQLLAELGLASLLVAALLLFGLFRTYKTIWMHGSPQQQCSSIYIGLGLTGLFGVMMFSYPLALTAPPIFLGIYLALLAGIASTFMQGKKEFKLASGAILYVVLALMTLTGAYYGKRELSAWNHGFFARALGERAFQTGENNPYGSRRIKLVLAQHVNDSIRLEPYAPELTRDNITSYTNLSLSIDHERLADTYRQQALEAALRHLQYSPYDSRMHMIVATRLGVDTDMALEHMEKAIELDPANLKLFEFMRDMTLPEERFEQAMTMYEFYIPRFYNRKVNSDYAYFASQAGQEQRAIEKLEQIDLSQHFKPESEQVKAAEASIMKLINRLQAAQQAR